MSTVKANNVQVGQSGTATNNFTLYQPSTPDGTVRLAVGNSGATSADVLTANSSGNVGIGETSPGTRLDVKGNGVPLTINSANSNGNKVQFEDNGTVKAYFGTTSFGGVVDCCFQASDSSGNTRFSVVAASGTIGLNTQPATTGTGITFPATQSASSDANTLDDYEEGTFEVTSLTPNTSGSITLKTAEKYMAYTKIGRLVVITGQIEINSVSSPVGFYVTLAGLPFAINNWSSPSDGAGYAGGVVMLYQSNTAGTGQITRTLSVPSNGGTSLFIYVDASTIAANNSLVFNFSYVT